ncbi:MAG: UDP-N-acetylmuramoyl-L-alanine--D-glutamate ligase [Clostridia bacterium]|nr:UDP-N-acetylmuramoyl-L-alanine--D-glutamate ligase [Clostridia bacterium]
MDNAYKKYFEGLKGKNVAVIGVGISNLPLIYMLLSYGAKVCARDKKSKEALGGTYDELVRRGARVIAGEDYLSGLTEDIIFKTPGMRYDVKELADARARGAVVTSEMEVFMELCPARVFAVTGSDGKTTTTTLIYEMLKKQGFTCHLGGNIGAPLLPKIAEIKADDMVVLELSSFQLHTMKKSPDAALITNLTPNHLDYHKSMDEYVDAKKNIYLHQSESARLVLNRDNDITNAIYAEMKDKRETLGFSKTPRDEDGAYLDGEDIVMIKGKKRTRFMAKSDIYLPGMHNVENYLAAIAMVWGYVSPENILYTARNFRGVAHRIEFVRELHGVRYYNDSIASSPTRTLAGLNSFNQKLIVIAGGYDKKLDYTVMGDTLIEKVKTLVLTGATADKIDAAVRENKNYRGEPEIIRADTFEQAVLSARDAAHEGDVVILSPASASFDLFKNFEERGNEFKRIVNGLN